MDIEKIKHLPSTPGVYLFKVEQLLRVKGITGKIAKDMITCFK